MGKQQTTLKLKPVATLDSERVTAEDIAAECERRAQLHRQEAERLEHAAFVLRGVLALPDPVESNR